MSGTDLFRKYATLPDVDSAPDIYETPEFVDDSIAQNEGNSQGSSPTSSGTEDSGEESTSRVDRQRIHPDEARDRFFPARLDANGVDFSDRISSKPKSYHVRKGRRRRNNGGRGVDPADSSSEESETLARRIARLNREVEEVQNEISSANASKEVQTGETGDLQKSLEEQKESMTKLSRIMTSLQMPEKQPAFKARKGNSELPGQQEHMEHEQTRPLPSSVPTSVQTHSDTTRILSKASALEARLSSLEAALGISSTLLPESSNTTSRSNKPILSHLTTLEAHMTTLTSATLPSLDSMKAQIDALSTSSAHLAEARSAATSAQAAFLAARSTRSPDLDAILQEARTANSVVNDPVLVAQVEALYDALPTIEALAPLLPAVLERLRSLRGLHTDAAAVCENLAELEKRQTGLGGEITKWREGLERVEGALSKGENTASSNREVIEEWVKELEAWVENMINDKQ